MRKFWFWVNVASIAMVVLLLAYVAVLGYRVKTYVDPRGIWSCPTCGQPRRVTPEEEKWWRERIQRLPPVITLGEEVSRQVTDDLLEGDVRR